MATSLSSIKKMHFNIKDSNKLIQSKQTQAILATINNNEAQGLFLLANSKSDDTWDASLFFLKEFADFYAKKLCHRSKYQLASILPIPITKEDLAKFANKPIISANEAVFDNKNLTRLWELMNSYVMWKTEKHSIADFIANYLSNWQKVGCICFHLVENKQNEEYPFAFMPTLVNNLTHQADLVYLPLKSAIPKTHKLAEFDFLQPLFRLAQKLAWVKQLLPAGKIYQPSYWSANQAYSLLKDAEEIKNCGIIVILPDWWKKHNQPRLKFSIGNTSQSALNLQTLLSCEIELVHNDKPLTKAEIEMLSQFENSLVPFRGSWIEADAENLKKVIAQWDKLTATTADGISFIEGMRMLAGVNNSFVDANNQFDADNSISRSSYIAGPWLQQMLTKLRDPALLQNATPKKLTASKLRCYQQLGVNWLYFLTNLGLGVCLADDMGLGKSIQIIALLLLAKEAATNKTKKCSLLILPASLLANWKNELNKFAPSLTTCFLHPSETSAAELTEISANPKKLQNYDLALTTYASLWRQEWLLAQSWDKVILDEAQAIKNPSSKQTSAIKQLKSNVRIALTGTPIENSLTDLWSLFDFLLPGLLSSHNNFKKIVNRIEKTKGEQQTPNYDPISNLVRPYILRRLKTDKTIISDLPEKTEVNAYCGLTNLQARLYKKTIKELTVALKATETSAIKRKGLVLNYLLKFKQICNHPAQVLANGDYSPTHSGKFARLKQLCTQIKQKQEKVLIFTQFKTITKPLAVFLETVFGAPGLVLHGSTAIKKRQDIVSAFQSESGPPFMVLSLKAGGTGLNLTAANHVIHFDRWWNPAVENQATDRAFRIGQKSNVLVHKFVCSGTIEDNINSLIKQKTKLANVILSSNAQTPKLTELTNEEILQLVSLDLNRIQI